eukprot:15481606-Alexandrium_andersonii.AAC.2
MLLHCATGPSGATLVAPIGEGLADSSMPKCASRATCVVGSTRVATARWQSQSARYQDICLQHIHSYMMTCTHTHTR